MMRRIQRAHSAVVIQSALESQYNDGSTSHPLGPS